MAVVVKDLAAVAAEEVGVTKKDAEAVIKAAVAATIEALAEGEDVQITNFGSFKPYERAARKGRNPQTGEELHIEAKNAVKFRAGKNLKETVENA